MPFVDYTVCQKYAQGYNALTEKRNKYYMRTRLRNYADSYCEQEKRPEIEFLVKQLLNMHQIQKSLNCSYGNKYPQKNP